MNEQRLFAFLRQQPPATLLDLLQRAYHQLTVAQRDTVFYALYKRLPTPTVSAQELRQRITSFCTDSLAGRYYAPFEWNSKNYNHVPEETERWFDLLNDLLADSTQLSTQGEHAIAVEYFGLLYDLIEQMEEGDEIVFAHELGMWMLPGDEQPYLAAYVASLAAVSTPEEFTATVVPLIRRESASYRAHVYDAAVRVANKAQSAALKAEVKRQKIKTPMKQ
jgi:hypothetical protein